MRKIPPPMGARVISEEAWAEAVATLAEAGEVVVACHIHPDGDALGSMIGLGRFLAREGKGVWMGWGTDGFRLPPQFHFLSAPEVIGPPGSHPERPEVFVAIDCASVKRLELLQESFGSALVRINLDHHLSNDRFGDINLVDTGASSSAELTYELVRRMGGVPDASEATCFYTGIVTDTGRFQYPNTSPQTLRTAADLRELGVDHHLVATAVYESASLAYLHLVGIVLARARLDGGVVWSFLRQKDLDGVGLDETEDLIDGLRATGEGEVTVLFKEEETGAYKVSLRSRDEVDVSRIAKALGGGGHARAAGFSAEGSVEEIFETIRAQVDSPPVTSGR
ncbi:MAG: DHH family phosphoesterase [Actinomycetota bacterium]